MNRQPKPELESPPGYDSSNDRMRNNMTIQEIVSQLRIMHKWEDFDKLEEVLLSKEERFKAKIEKLKDMLNMETLARVNAEEGFKKREEMCEKGKKIQEAYETLMKDIKTSKSAERENIVEMRKKNGELEAEVLELRKLKQKLVDVSDAYAERRKMNGELESEVSELRKLKEKWVEVSDLNAELVKRNGELENKVGELRKLKGKLGDENTELRSRLCVFESKNGELEEKVKKNLATIDELRKENRKLEDEKGKYEKMVESLNRKFEELQVRVVKLEDDTERLTSVDVSSGGNNKEELSADNTATLNDKYEVDVHDNEFGNGNVEVSLQRNGDIRHSVGVAAGAAQPPSKGNKDVKVSSSARGRLESQKVIEIIDLDDDDDDDECTSPVLVGKKAGFGITVKNEHPSSSVEIQEENIFSKLEMIKRKISFSESDTSTSSDASASPFNLYDLPQLQAKRRKT